MKNPSYRKSISFILVLLIILSSFSFVRANANTSIIKSIIFEDDKGNLVYVDYAEAIEQSLNGDYTLYQAILDYVSTAEENGWDIYLETYDNGIFDYSKALSQNIYKLADIIENEDLIVTDEINFSHELWIDPSGNPVITPPDAKPAELVSITPVDDISVSLGTSKEELLDLLPSTTTIIDNKNNVHTVVLSWNLENYDKDTMGEYEVYATFELPPNVINKRGLELKVKTTITVYKPIEPPRFPDEVENVTIIHSEITGNYYANINIKEEFASQIESITVDDLPAKKVKNNPAQWRIKVSEGTSIEDLKGRVFVELISHKGNVQVSLFKDGFSGGYGIDFNLIKDTFYIQNKQTGRKYNIGSSPWNYKYVYQMQNIPVGEYTINFDCPEGMYIYQILLGESYKETVYDPDTNPLVVTEKGAKNYDYVKIQIRSYNTLKEIKQFDDIYLPSDITYDQFVESLPKQVVIVDSNDKEHFVNIGWETRPYNFDAWNKPGTYTVFSQLFTLPLEVSNTEPATRLKVSIKVRFQ